MKILLLDLETSPNTAYVWGMFKENIPLERLIETSTILCWSAKWLGENMVFFDSIQKHSEKELLLNIHNLLEEADAVVTYNGNSFDLPVLNKEFLLNKFPPPAPYKSIDLYQTVKKTFRFTSNKLDHITDMLNVGRKVKTTFNLWVDCMNGKASAWKQMKEYNINDVFLLEAAYLEIRPWIKGHPNYNQYTEVPCCPNCGSTSYTKRGFYYSAEMKYQRFKCKDCKTWFRNTKAIDSKSLEERFKGL